MPLQNIPVKTLPPLSFVCLTHTSAHSNTHVGLTGSAWLHRMKSTCVGEERPVLNEWVMDTAGMGPSLFLSQKMCSPYRPPPPLTCSQSPCSSYHMPAARQVFQLCGDFSSHPFRGGHVQMSPFRSERNTLLCFDCVTCHDLIACTKDKSPDLL